MHASKLVKFNVFGRCGPSLKSLSLKLGNFSHFIVVIVIGAGFASDTAATATLAFAAALTTLVGCDAAIIGDATFPMRRPFGDDTDFLLYC